MQKHKFVVLGSGQSVLRIYEGTDMRLEFGSVYIYDDQALVAIQNLGLGESVARLDCIVEKPVGV